MKILLLHPAEPERQAPRVSVLPDSAVTVGSLPVFLPEPEVVDGPWAAVPVAAFRVSRLGKGVSARFARRHVDAVAPALRVMPREALADESAYLHSHGSLPLIFDGALTILPWVPLPQEADTLPPLLFGTPGAERELPLQEALDALPQALAHISAACTLKSGDVLIPLPPAAAAEREALEALPGMKFTLRLGAAASTVKIK